MTDERDGRSLRDLFGLDGGEFMDTGMTLKEWLAARDLERIKNSYVTQSRTEQKRRREIVIKLAVEGSRIRKIDRFGSAVLKSAVEDVMEGNWEEVQQDIEWCFFRHVFLPSREEDVEAMEPEAVRKCREKGQHYAKLWEPFRKLLELAYAGRPRPGESKEKH